MLVGNGLGGRMRIQGSSAKEEKRYAKSEIVTRCQNFLDKNDSVQLQG